MNLGQKTDKRRFQKHLVAVFCFGLKPESIYKEQGDKCENTSHADSEKKKRLDANRRTKAHSPTRWSEIN